MKDNNQAPNRARVSSWNPKSDYMAFYKSLDELNAALLGPIKALRDGYMSGNFEALFPYLAEDVIKDSQWMLIPVQGKDEVMHYFRTKGKAFAAAQKEVCVECTMAQFVGYKDGVICLYLLQQIRGESSDMIVDVLLNDEGMVRRIDVLMPLFELAEYPLLND